MSKLHLSILMFRKVKGEAVKQDQANHRILARQPVTFSRSKFKNRQEFTLKRFRSLVKKITLFHSLKIQHGTMLLKALNFMGKFSSGREYIAIFFRFVSAKSKRNTNIRTYVKRCIIY